jgi:serine/threonine protein kinase
VATTSPPLAANWPQLKALHDKSRGSLGIKQLGEAGRFLLATENWFLYDVYMDFPSCPRCGRRFAPGTRMCPTDLIPLRSAPRMNPALLKTMPEPESEPTSMDLSKTNPGEEDDEDLERTMEDSAVPERFAELAKIYAQSKPRPPEPTLLDTPRRPDPTTTEFNKPKRAPSHPELAPNMRIGEYQLVEKIGDGGMGEIWKAVHPQIQKQVAIKFLLLDLLDDKTNVHRFTKEARAVNQIQHKNLIDIFSFGELQGGRPYFVMEYVQGKSLRARLSEGPLSAVEVLQLFEQLCSALQATHEKGIIHRDLKPENIFFTSSVLESLIVKIADFGVAKLPNDEDDAAQRFATRPGALLGTVGYMAPEQLDNAKTVDPRADIYSLGCILYEVLVGKPAFTNIKNVATYASRQLMPLAVASKEAPQQNIPAALDALIHKLLSPKAKDRPFSCNELFQLLQDAYLPPDVTVPEPAPSSPPEKKVLREATTGPNITQPETKMSNTVKLALSGVFLILLGFALWLVVQRFL